jgi:hypothetical protein
VVIAPRPASAFDWLPVWVSVDEHFWAAGALPACGAPQFVWVDDGVLAVGRGPLPIASEVSGDADAATCLVRIAVGSWHALSVPEKCMLIVHELGHLYGPAVIGQRTGHPVDGDGHTARGIMAATDDRAPPWQDFRPCASLMRQSLVRSRWVRPTPTALWWAAAARLTGP